jgi:protein-disulfide isomerase
MSGLTPPLGERDHRRGGARAQVTLVEYGDYQCPYCGELEPTLEAVRRFFGERLRFGYRHFPLAEVHEFALAAAEAAEAAGAQGRFWEMHETLYRNQGALDRPQLSVYADWLGLDVERFDRELDGHTHLERVRADVLSGARSGVNGTPSLFIAGRRYDGGRDLGSLVTVIEQVAQGSGAEA